MRRPHYLLFFLPLLLLLRCQSDNDLLDKDDLQVLTAEDEQYVIQSQEDLTLTRQDLKLDGVRYREVDVDGEPYFLVLLGEEVSDIRLLPRRIDAPNYNTVYIVQAQNPVVSQYLLDFLKGGGIFQEKDKKPPSTNKSQ